MLEAITGLDSIIASKYDIFAQVFFLQQPAAQFTGLVLVREGRDGNIRKEPCQIRFVFGHKTGAASHDVTNAPRKSFHCLKMIDVYRKLGRVVHILIMLDGIDGLFIIGERDERILAGNTGPGGRTVDGKPKVSHCGKHLNPASTRERTYGRFGRKESGGIDVVLRKTAVYILLCPVGMQG